jgi:hypothetical protein
MARLDETIRRIIRRIELHGVGLTCFSHRQCMTSRIGRRKCRVRWWGRCSRRPCSRACWPDRRLLCGDSGRIWRVRYFVSSGRPFRVQVLALHRLRCAGLIHVVRIESKTRCIGEGRLELGLSRGATVDVVDLHPTDQIDGCGLDCGGYGQQGQSESRNA